MTSADTTAELKRTAHHEAGHAVFAVACQVPVDYVEILPGGGGGCYLRFDSPSFPVGDRDFADALKVAGSLTEAAYAHVPPRLSYTDHYEMARAYDLTPEEQPPWFVTKVFEASKRAWGVLQPRMTAVEAVAEALVKRGRLSGREVRRLCREALSDGERN